jgi:presenilin-like A22 family membrane protease
MRIVVTAFGCAALCALMAGSACAWTGLPVVVCNVAALCGALVGGAVSFMIDD